MEIIAHIYTDFPEKFGIPRQSGLIEELKGDIIFEPKYRNPDAVKGLETYDYIWLLWEFEGIRRDNWSATVKPPRLGGNTHMGVFATRSPFRPNPIGLSCVKLDGVELSQNQGPIIHVSGIDLRDKTPIYDIKPYLTYSECHPNASYGFASEVKSYSLDVVFPEHLLNKYPTDKRNAIIEVLKQDPRPAYHNDFERQYGVSFAGYDVRFTVQDNTLTVREVVPL